jgi:hypothetical protein
MSRSAGPGSPITFMCHKLRTKHSYAVRYFAQNDHRVTRTGRTRPYWPQRGSALGQRSMLTSHEYICTCGHRGWSNHIDILRTPVDEIAGKALR